MMAFGFGAPRLAGLGQWLLLVTENVGSARPSSCRRDGWRTLRPVHAGVWALGVADQGCSLQQRLAGERLVVVGASGAGKSTVGRHGAASGRAPWPSVSVGFAVVDGSTPARLAGEALPSSPGARLRLRSGSGKSPGRVRHVVAEWMIVALAAMPRGSGHAPGWVSGQEASVVGYGDYFGSVRRA